VKEVKPIAGQMPMACEMQFTLHLGQYLTQKNSEELGRHIFIVAAQGTTWNYCSYCANLVVVLPHILQSVHPHQTSVT